MTILIRLPNWLGDLVMSTALMRCMRQWYPKDRIEVIVKKGIDPVVDYIPGIDRKWIFSKDQYPGLKGAWQFGRKMRAEVRPDLFVCIPDSFSSALMAFASGAPVRVGYQKEMRSLLLTHHMDKDPALHRVDQYLALLQLLGKSPETMPQVYLQRSGLFFAHRVLVNVNSEAEARRLPVPKAISILNALRAATDAEIVLVGSPKEKPHVQAIYNGLDHAKGIVNLAGTTDMHGLIELLGSAPVMLTTDSGPMHVANALGTHTVALEGASDERNTAPYNASRRTLIRYGQLPCEPCVKNVCQFGVPKCLMGMDEHRIVKAVVAALNAAV